MLLDLVHVFHECRVANTLNGVEVRSCGSLLRGPCEWLVEGGMGWQAMATIAA